MTKLINIPNSITDFHDEYYWLDNMWKCRIRWNSQVSFNSVEQGFVYFKTRDLKRREQILQIEDPYEVKGYGRAMPMREDWDDIKFGIMYQLVNRKFMQNQDLMQKLLATRDKTLIEGNTWHDNIWGVCVCPTCRLNAIEGQNWLGMILMSLRVQFREGV